MRVPGGASLRAMSPKGMRAAGRLGWKARVAELVDAPDLGSGAFGREGSSPFSRTTAVIRALVERPVADEAGRDGCAGRSVVASDPGCGAPRGSFRWNLRVEPFVQISIIFSSQCSLIVFLMTHDEYLATIVGTKNVRTAFF